MEQAPKLLIIRFLRFDSIRSRPLPPTREITVKPSYHRSIALKLNCAIRLLWLKVAFLGVLWVLFLRGRCCLLFATVDLMLGIGFSSLWNAFLKVGQVENEMRDWPHPLLMISTGFHVDVLRGIFCEW